MIWHSTEPDFTKCFHSTILVYFPCAFIWLMLPLHQFWYEDAVRTPPLKKWAKITVTRLAMITILCFLCVVQFGMRIHQHIRLQVAPISELVAPAVLFSGTLQELEI